MLVFEAEKHFETNPHSIYSASHKAVYPGEDLTRQEFVEYYENNSPFHTFLNNPGSDAEEWDYSRQFPRKCLYMLMRRNRKHQRCSGWRQESRGETWEVFNYVKAYCKEQSIKPLSMSTQGRAKTESLKLQRRWILESLMSVFCHI